MLYSSCSPWSVEWDYLGYVKWASVLVNMGSYPGGWSKGLAFPAYDHLDAKPCLGYPEKQCGLEGTGEHNCLTCDITAGRARGQQFNGLI